MTLILLATTEHCAVVVSDGLEFQYKEDESRYVAEESRQKLFPIPGRSIVLAAHGENRLAATGGDLNSRRLLGEVFGDLSEKLQPAATVEGIAGRLLDLLGANINYTFELLKYVRPNKKTALGVLVVGFDSEGGNLKGVEVYWPWIGKREDPRLIELFKDGPVRCAGTGGACATFVIRQLSRKFDIRNLRDASERRLQLYVRGVYQEAQKLQSRSAPDFGGQYQEVTVTRDSWRWTTP